MEVDLAIQMMMTTKVMMMMTRMFMMTFGYDDDKNDDYDDNIKLASLEAMLVQNSDPSTDQCRV